MVLGGFSQGAAVALWVASRSNDPLGGVVALSGWLDGYFLRLERDFAWHHDVGTCVAQCKGWLVLDSDARCAR